MAPNFMDNNEIQTQTWFSLQMLITDLLMVTSEPNFITPFFEAYAVMQNTHKLSVQETKGWVGRRLFKMNQPCTDD